MPADKNKVPNKLIDEKSPYLLQHAHNPVDWFPWGDEAFEKAKTEDKPVFLSIGYSTCHWCHVMEHESFEDDKVADILNRGFVSVKVDREERPDVDAVYMAVCQSLTGQGGWPLTILMDPERRPFYAATYLPPKSRYGMTGLTELLLKVSELWKTSRLELSANSEKIMQAMRESEGIKSAQEPDKDLIAQAFETFRRSFDSRYGGFGSAPKFPAAHNLLFLLRYAGDENPEALSMVLKTLDDMYRGGLFDHIGGGFSRYSTDRRWLVPHFEKMLYDNALLAMAYSEACKQTGQPHYAHIIRKTLDFISAELTGAEGGFYCGQDADSDGVEGKYYVFTPQEICRVLGEEEGQRFCRWFDITPQGNFEGKSIPNLIGNDAYREIHPEMEKHCKKLSAYRFTRTKLHKDDKCLTSWNALMIIAFLKAYHVMEEDRYLSIAEKAERFITEKLTEGSRLFVRYRDGDSSGYGKLDDYAYYIWALLELYQTTFDVRYLTKAVRLAGVMCEQFFDDTEGGFYLYAKEDEQLIIRPKETYDGAMPSGNSVAAYVLEKLYKITGETKWQEKSEKQLRCLAGQSRYYPAGHSFAMIAMMNALSPSCELVVLSPDLDDLNRLRRLSAERSNLTVLVKTRENESALAELVPYTKEYGLAGPGKQFYLCTGGSCAAPVSSLDQLAW